MYVNARSQFLARDRWLTLKHGCRTTCEQSLSLTLICHRDATPHVRVRNRYTLTSAEYNLIALTILMGMLPKFDAQEILSLHCPLCSFHSHWTEKLEAHFAKTHLGKSAEFCLYRCSLCKKVASSEAFIVEHLELHHKIPMTTEDAPASPSSDTDTLVKPHNPNENSKRPDSTPGHLPSPKNGVALPVFSGFLEGDKVVAKVLAVEGKKDTCRHQCLFCEFSTSIREVLAGHYVHHGIKNLHCDNNTSQDCSKPTSDISAPIDHCLSSKETKKLPGSGIVTHDPNQVSLV